MNYENVQNTWKVQWHSWVQSFFQTKSGDLKKCQQALTNCQQKFAFQINASNIVNFAN